MATNKELQEMTEYELWDTVRTIAQEEIDGELTGATARHRIAAVATELARREPRGGGSHEGPGRYVVFTWISHEAQGGVRDSVGSFPLWPDAERTAIRADEENAEIWDLSTGEVISFRHGRQASRRYEASPW